MADGQIADGYAPSSIKEFVKYGISGVGLLVLLKKFMPGLAIRIGASDGVWQKQADGSLLWMPSAPKATAG